MSAPVLSRALVLETPVDMPDGAGGFVRNWDALGVCWADVMARSGRERVVSGAPGSQVSYRIVVRGAPEGDIKRPKPEQRFREGERVFSIQAVAEHDRRGLYLTCYAQEAVVQ